MKRRNTLFILFTLLFSLTAMAQQNPVHFSVQQKQVSPTEVEVIFTAKIDQGWHVYSTNLPADGPTSASLHVDKAEGVTPVGKLTTRGKELNVYDKTFEMKLRYFENSVGFVQRYKITAKTYSIKGYLEYGACNDEMCLPPTQVEFNFKGNGPASAPAATPTAANAETEKTTTAATDVAADGLSALTAMTADTAKKSDVLPGDTAGSVKQENAQVNADVNLWQPVIKELSAFNSTKDSTNSSLWSIFFMGILGGFIALLTPCVWPIIPMTVSFFLKRAKDDRKKGIRDAVTYGLSIIVIYMGLATLVTWAFGPQKLNELATNAPFNVFFFLLLAVFAFSFFGWFELRLPSSWGNAVDNKASATTGLLSIFLMAFTLSLVSFSCTAPVVGLLLVQAATSGDWVAPAVGMFGFALALALPFTFFALFPTLLKKAPKSGSWMNMIKVVLGFIELAFSLKFLSVADLAYGWHILDRETFLSIWIVLFGLLGLYLIGKLKFPHDDPDQKAMPVPAIMLGLCSLAFSVYMLPGLWGAPSKAVSAFAPPINTQDFNLAPQTVHAAYTDYDEGMRAAAAAGKPVLVDFTGFGCVNCRKMEASVWTDSRVADKLNKDYVLISLYVDDKTPLKQPVEVKLPDGTSRTLRTIGDKWSYLQQTKFGYLAQPFYVPLDNAGKPLNGSFSFKEDVPAYLEFLDKGLENYRAQHQ
ncbi:protein-disulfide reductase DsbD family protein [Prevotella melaninogenica]|uniref:protein-disulfide reductase DsbD family protein n=1 Tax=Prevotella melaninogenica TaxID=28132 RepID=UPI001C5D3E52|nr:cytochrome c biogenesis protein CcdA [Prevotella melaninogenica]MBW4733289.1 thioredoxin family protein [Prevotella melaninogenica]MBW4735791.1 thioredoxin family protein [Prevotella melaninogenica]MBW4878350.1 thioredoxin family protein [Prevotella melaninogenica]